ncbi:MAG: small multi-drug export protein [Lachnospiraceae bacterium]|nr:small multi-drug export protein [Lachnospiraceae bacterium]
MIVFIISLMPILELRGGLIAAALLKIPYLKAAAICIVGNILPIPFILMFLNKIFDMMEKWELTKKLVLFFKKRAIKNKSKIDKYGLLGLILFVGVPLPGTGAWTGALVASVFNMDIKKSSIGIFLGILLAFVIMSIISYGVIGNIIR